MRGSTSKYRDKAGRPGGPDARRYLEDPAENPPAPRHSHGRQAGLQARAISNNRSEAVLNGLGWECLHDLTRGLSLYHTDLAEDLALAGLGRWLCPGLEPAKAGQIKDARLGHLPM